MMNPIGNTTPTTNNDQLRRKKTTNKQVVPSPRVDDVIKKPFVERRRGDRRRDSQKDPLLDSRSGTDRRKRPSIDITT